MFFQYHHGRKLVGDRTSKSCLLLSNVSESMFADNAALYASSREGFEAVASSFIVVAKGWGLTVSLAKSKGMVVGTGVDSAVLSPFTIEGGVIDIVESFQYLGSSISSDGELQVEVSQWLAKGCLDVSASPSLPTNFCQLTPVNVFILLPL